MSETTTEGQPQGAPIAAETERQPERRLLNPEMAGAQAVALHGGTLPGGKLDSAKIEKIDKGEEAPDTTIATKASFNERDDHWKAIPEEQRMTQWQETTNAFFARYKETPEKEFLAHIGIDLTSTNVSQAVYDKFFAKEGGKGDLGVLASAIHAGATPDLIETHKALILALGKLYGKNSSDVLLLLVEGMQNAKPETVGQFTQEAQTQIATGEDMKGYQILKTLNEQSAAWDTKAAAIEADRQRREQEEAARRAAATPPAESDEPIIAAKPTPELAEHPDDYKAALIAYLKTTTYGAQAWKFATDHELTSLADITIDNTKAESSGDEGKHISFGAAPMGEREHLLFEASSFPYEREVVYRLLHEVSHKLNPTLALRTITAEALQARAGGNNQGFSLIGGQERYAEKNPATQANEDTMELVTMYLLDPNYLRSFLEYLSSTDPEHAKERERLKLATISTEKADEFFDTIATAVHDKLQIEKIEPEATEKSEMTIDDLAARMFDYQTGEVQNFPIDMLDTYTDILSTLQTEALKENSQAMPANQPAVILSPLVQTMLNKIASQNFKGKELTLSLQGVYIKRENGNHVFVPAFVVFGSEPVDAADVGTRSDIQETSAKEMLENLHLSDIFQNPPEGMIAGTMQLHFDPNNPLDDEFSPADREQAEQWLVDSETDPKANPPFWGVMAKNENPQPNEDAFDIRCVQTYRDEDGMVEEQELRILE